MAVSKSQGDTTKFGKKLSVASSFISHIAYEPNSKSIAVWFKNGSHAIYAACTPDEFKRFLESADKGNHYTTFIKNMKLRRPEADYSTGRDVGSAWYQAKYGKPAE